MIRAHDGEAERLATEVSVLRLVEAAGVTLQKRDKNFTGDCPFHGADGAEGSFTVVMAANRFQCSACGAAGGPIEWVMRKNGVSFRHAVELLREGMGTVTAETVKQTTVRALPPPVSFDADDQTLLDQVTDYYHQTLKQSPEALAYLQARGLSDPALIDVFKLGYANRTLGLRLPNKQRKEGAEIRAKLERLGVYRESGHEHLNGSVVFPVLDDGGHTTGMYGRKIIHNLRPGTPMHLYLPGPHRGVWNLDGIAGADGEVILAESLIDAATFWCAGYRNVTAAYGPDGLTEDHLAAFKRFGIQRVVIAFDRDDEGEHGAARVAQRLMVEGIACYRIPFPKGMDANEYALKVTPAAKSLGVLIRKAEWLSDGGASSSEPAPPPTTAVSDVVPAPSVEAEHPEPEPVIPVPVPDRKRPRKPKAEIAKAEQPVASAAPPPPSLTTELEPPIDHAAQPLPARVLGEELAPEPVAETSSHEVNMVFGDRRYRVRGLAKNSSYEVMRINVLVTDGTGLHVDSFDLYAAKARQVYARAASAELGVEESVVQRDLGRLLLKLEELQDTAIQSAMTPQAAGAVEMTKADEEAALALLGDPNLVERLTADFARTGLVGEPVNALAGYLAAVSRKLAAPLAIIIQSTSAAGKSALMEAVLRLVPEEDRVQYSAMTGQSLFYLGEKNLRHKILAIAEEEGVRQAAYALKLLQSQGELTIASTGKDPETGHMVTQEYRVEGPVMLFLTTTAIDIDEELLNRCLVLTIDESREQTRAILERQRLKRTLAGLLADAEAESLIALHRNAQRLIKPVAVVNPYADQLSFLDEKTRTRRDHQKYLTLIDAIALLHQHQREVKSITHGGKVIEYVEVAPADIALANRLAHDVLGRSLDELPPQTRSVLGAIRALVEDSCRAKGLVRSDVRFTRRDLRAMAGGSDTQLKLHLSRLVDLEYVIAHRMARSQSLLYELIYDGDGGGGPHLSGLIEATSLRYDAGRSADAEQRSGSGRPSVASRSGHGRTTNSAASTSGVMDFASAEADTRDSAQPASL